MKKLLTLAAAVVVAGLLQACNCGCNQCCKPCCPEPVYRSPCCPAPSGDVTGPWGAGGGGAVGGGGGGAASCGSCGK